MIDVTIKHQFYRRFATYTVPCVLAVVLGSAAHAGEARPSGLPPDAVKLSPCVAAMGEHWGNRKNVPLGPYYGVYEGRLVFTELMISQKDLIAGKSWDDLIKPLPGHAIDHVDIDFKPHGHRGYPIPHYDVHAYYVPHAEHLAFCNKP